MSESDLKPDDYFRIIREWAKNHNGKPPTEQDFYDDPTLPKPRRISRKCGMSWSEIMDNLELSPPAAELIHSLPHTDKIAQIGWGVDESTLVSISIDKTIRIWNMEAGSLTKSIHKNFECRPPLAFSPGGRRLCTVSRKDTILIWDDLETESPRILEGVFGRIMCVSWAPDGKLLASGSTDHTIRIWNTEENFLCYTLERHKGSVLCLCWSPGEPILASGSQDNSICIWDSSTGSLYHKLEGHKGSVQSVAWSPNGNMLASGSEDKTVRIWNTVNGRLERVLEGYTKGLKAVSYNSDGRILATKTSDHSIKFWCCETWKILKTIDAPYLFNTESGILSFHAKSPILISSGENDKAIHIWDINTDSLLSNGLDNQPTTHYVNAKVVMIGNGGVGKTTLGIRLAENEFRHTELTHGAQFWQIKVPEGIAKVDGISNLKAEITLWDFAGQIDYRIVHQLFLDDVDAVLLLFDCSDPDYYFPGVDYWSGVLKEQKKSKSIKYLIASRCDECSITADKKKIDHQLKKSKLNYFFSISSKTGENIEEFSKHLMKHIPWDKLPRTSTPKLFSKIRQMLLEQKNKDITFVSTDAIRHQINNWYPSCEDMSIREKTDAVIDLLQARGFVYRLELNPELSLVLLKPALINKYAASIIQAARNSKHGDGSILESDVLKANLKFENFTRLKPYDEKTVLQLTVELLIAKGLCIREMGHLIFPSQINATRSKPKKEKPLTITKYQFSGAIETIYATLIVRLTYTDYFHRLSQWKYSAEFSCEGKTLGGCPRIRFCNSRHPSF